ncbi:MAG: serine/threonine-protein kinase [Kofleriaceae bacterium]
MPSASPSAPAPERLPLGSVLDGRYRIDDLVGIGGMGSVYRCEHTGIGRPVAIKVLHSDFIGNREASLRFQREAIASGRLDHPNIVGVSDFGLLEDGGCYLVMEFLEGESLGSRLERERIPWREAIEIVRGVLRGLRHAHDRGVVHRDIKPDNVFLAVKDGDPITKILDFGIAKLFAGGTDDPAATRAGITVGTPAYLSPEQAVGGEITPASDLYSTSVLLFEMLTGRPPFEDQDPLAMLGAHVGRPPPEIAEIAPELVLPPELEPIVRHGLAKRPDERFTSANDYLRELAQLLPATLGRPGNESATFSALPFDNDATMVVTAEARAAAEAAARPVAPLEDPLPRSWLTSAAALFGALVAIGLIVTLVGRRAPAEAPSSRRDPAEEAATTALVAEGKAARARRLRDALGQLTEAKDCRDRKAALEEILELDRALPLRDAGVLAALHKLRDAAKTPATACLVEDLPRVIKRLTASTAASAPSTTRKRPPR